MNRFGFWMPALPEEQSDRNVRSKVMVGALNELDDGICYIVYYSKASKRCRQDSAEKMLRGVFCTRGGGCDLHPNLIFMVPEFCGGAVVADGRCETSFCQK